MAPKNNAKGSDKKAGGKGKGKDGSADDGGKGKGGGGKGGGLKAATSINVRHILVCLLICRVQRKQKPMHGGA